MSISNILIENIQFMVQCQHSCTDETCINSHAIQLTNSKHKYKRKHGSVLLSHKLLTKWPRSVKTYLRLRTSRGLRKVFFSDVLGTVLPESSFLSAFIEFILETLCQLYQKHNRGWHLLYFSLFFFIFLVCHYKRTSLTTRFPINWMPNLSLSQKTKTL